MTDMPVPPPAAAAPEIQAAAEKPHSPWHDVWVQLRRHKGAMFGVVILALILAITLLGPLVWDINPTKNDILARNNGMTGGHPLGTDHLGRDLLARMMAGGRISLAVGVTAMGLSIFLGTLIGALAGYFKGLDALLMRLTDLFLALPLLPLLLLMMTLFRDPLAKAFGPEGGIFILIVGGIAVTSWMHTARIVRGEVLVVKEREFVLAARSIGAPAYRIIGRHILPNVLSPVMVSATLGVANAIITESALSFLGLGFPPDFPTWGRLLFDAMERIQLYPWQVILPGIAISLTVLSVNYIGNGLRDALDPRSRGR